MRDNNSFLLQDPKTCGFSSKKELDEAIVIIEWIAKNFEVKLTLIRNLEDRLYDFDRKKMFKIFS